MMEDGLIKNFPDSMMDDHPDFSHDHMQNHVLLSDSRNDKDFFTPYDAHTYLPPVFN